MLTQVFHFLCPSAAAAAPPAVPAANVTRGFVTRSGTQLLLDGKPFYHLGFNGVW
jgi:stage V sporulation protein SpoVS